MIRNNIHTFAKCASQEIARNIYRHLGTPLPRSVSELRKQLWQEYGVGTFSVFEPYSRFVASVRGNEDEALIIYNAAIPGHMQRKALIHELAEWLAVREAPDFCDHIELSYARYTDASSCHHLAAQIVERKLC